MRHIPTEQGRVIWQATGFDASARAVKPPTISEPRRVDWLVGEIVTNLYAGLCRFRRGERLAAMRERIVELSETPPPPPHGQS